MTRSDVIQRVQAAERELQPLFDFINSGAILPSDGCLSYTYACAQLRANDTRRALIDLMVHAAQHADTRRQARSKE